MQVDIDLPNRAYTEQVFIIHWNYLSDRELQYIGWSYEWCFSLSFLSKLADPTSCHHPCCDLIHLGIPTEIVLSINPQIKSTGLQLEWYSLRQWHNCLYVSVTQSRNSNRLLSFTGLTIVQECRMSLLCCWRISNFLLMYEPCLCKGCYWVTPTFISMACHRVISHSNY